MSEGKTSISKAGLAVSLFREGFSCSQAVAAVYDEETGVPRDTLLRIAQPFGGGIGRMADWCGAVTGAFLVIGLKHGRIRAEDLQSRDRTYAWVREFTARFRNRHGDTACRNLLGCDISTAEGMKSAEELKLHEIRCEKFVRDAVDILEDIL